MHRIGTVGKQGLRDAPAELLGVRTVTDEVQKRARIEIVAQVQISQLLADHPDHASQRGADGFRSWHAAFGIQHIGQPPAYTMGLAFDFGDAVPHGEKQCPVTEVTRKQPETIITEIQYDPTLGELRSQLRPWHDSDRTAMSRFLGRADRCPIQGRKFPAGEQQVPCGKKHQGIISAGLREQFLTGGAIGLGAGQPLLCLLNERSHPVGRRLRVRHPVGRRRGRRG